MSRYDDEKKAVNDAAAKFPITFGLRAFPGDVFRVSPTSSYFSEMSGVMLYTEVWRVNKWLSFAKGTPNELLREVVVRSYKMRDGSMKPENELFAAGALFYNGGGYYEIPKSKEILFAPSEIGPEGVEND